MTDLPPKPTKDEALGQCRAFLFSLIGNSSADRIGLVDGGAPPLRQYIRENAPWLIEQIDTVQHRRQVLADVRKALGTLQTVAEKEKSPLASLVKDHAPWLLERIEGALS